MKARGWKPFDGEKDWSDGNEAAIRDAGSDTESDSDSFLDYFAEEDLDWTDPSGEPLENGWVDVRQVPEGETAKFKSKINDHDVLIYYAKENETFESIHKHLKCPAPLALALIFAVRQPPCWLTLVWTTSCKPKRWCLSSPGRPAPR